MRTAERAFILATAGVLSACGLINGIGGPWPPGQTTDGGTVVPPGDGGVCPEGTHNGGDGQCAPLGQCSNGFSLDGTGVCAGWIAAAAISPARALHTVTGLSDGRALSVGGLAGTVPIAAGPASLYDPASDSWTQTDAVRERYGHTATHLAGNRVVVVGGSDSDGLVGPAELYRVDQDRWVELDELLYPRRGHQTVELEGGRLLVMGGVGANGATLSIVEYLQGGGWVALNNGLNTARKDFAAVVTTPDEVLVTGGLNGQGEPLASVEAYSTGSNAFAVRSAMTDARTQHTATRLDSGRILVVGGLTDAAGGLEPLRTVEVYDPVADSWSDLASLTVPRYGHSATLLDDGRVLVVGGFGASGAPVASVEIVDPSTGGVEEGPPLSNARGHHPAARIAGGHVLVLQGSLTDDDAAPVTSAERFAIGY